MMDSLEYQKLYKLETTYWWHVGRRAIIANLLSNNKLIGEGSQQEKELNSLSCNGSNPEELSAPTILDIGCGTGENIKFLSRYGKVIGIDASKQAIEFCRKRKLKNAKIGRAEALPFKENSFDLVTVLDLLEHLDDDLLALRESYRVLKNGGTLLVTVPACPMLWSEHDIALHHKRRYSRRKLKTQIRNAGFKIRKLSFAVTIMFLPIFSYRLLKKLFARRDSPETSYVLFPHWLNHLFINILKLEAWALKHIDFPFGVSLVCVAEKNEGKPQRKSSTH